MTVTITELPCKTSIFIASTWLLSGQAIYIINKWQIFIQFKDTSNDSKKPNDTGLFRD